MRRFVAEALVDAASLVAIFFVLSLIQVPSRSRSADSAPIVELTSGPSACWSLPRSWSSPSVSSAR